MPLSLLLFLALQVQVNRTAIIRGHAFSINTGTPLKGVQVVLTSKRQGRPTGSASLNTQRDGAFEFPRLEAGVYTVQCSKKGYLSAGHGSKGVDQPPAEISVRDDQTISDADCRLQHNGSINGTIIDEDGDLLSDVQVSALVRTYRHGQPRYTRGAGIKTDDHGHYRLYELPPGRYCLQAWRPANLTEPALAPVFYPNSQRLVDCQMIDLRHGEEATGINVTLREVPSFTLKGKIRDPRSGRPLAGFNLQLAPEEFGGDGWSAQIRPDGSFEFLKIMPGRYRLTIAVVDDRERLRPWVKLVEMGSSDQEISLVPGVWPRVTGLLNMPKTPPVLGAQIMGARVMLIPHDNSPPLEAQVGGNGTFQIDYVLPGNYDVAVQGIQVPYFVSEMSANGRDALDNGIAVLDGDRVVPFTATLDFQPSFITGHIIDDDGKPLSGAGLVAWNADPEKRMVERYFKTAFSDASGNYRLANLPPGEYFVAIWADYDPPQALEPDILRRLESVAVRVNTQRQESQAHDLRMTQEVRAIPASFVR